MNRTAPDIATEDGRLAILYVAPELLVWMCSGRFNTTENKLPADVQIVRLFIGHPSTLHVQPDMFGVILTSNEFAEVKTGEVIPALPPSRMDRLADIEKLEVNRNSVLVLSGIERPEQEVKQLRTQLDERLGPDSPSLILSCGLWDEAFLAVIDEDRMREHGWVRAASPDSHISG